MFKSIFHYCLSLSLFFLIPSLASARSVVMMFGDSITQGSPYRKIPGDGENIGPSVRDLEDLLNNSYRSSLVLNWGAGGTNSYHGVQRISSNMATTRETHSGDQYFILLHYGTNDRSYGLLPSDTGFNTRQMIDAATDWGVTPIVGGLLPKSSEENLIEYNKEIQAAANSLAVAYVNHYPDFLPVSDDLFVLEKGVYLHPNLTGYSLIASNWFDDSLSSMIEAEPPPPEIIPIITSIINLVLDDD